MSEPKANKTFLRVAIALALLVLACGTYYFFLPQALTRSEFQKTLRIALMNNFQSVEMSLPIREQLSNIEKGSGRINAIRAIQMLDPRFTYPTLQANVFLERNKSYRYESYTFTIGADGQLVLRGLKSEPTEIINRN